MPSSAISLGPLRRANSLRVTDRVLGGSFMRGGVNVEVRDGEWWSRKGEECLLPRLGSSPWWWMIDVDRELTVICNPWHALALVEVSAGVYAVENLQSAAATETGITLTNGTRTFTSSLAGEPNSDWLILVGGTGSIGQSSEVYRVISRSGTTVTMDRAYEGTTGAKNLMYLRTLARTVAGSGPDHDDTARVIGNACIFEQLATHAAEDIVTGVSPAVTAGHVYLIITSNQGIPVAIDLTAYRSGTPVSPLRNWLYQTSLGPGSATVVGSDTAEDGLTPRGVYSAVYKNRLFIGAAPDPEGMFGSRTLWWSGFGDFLIWHSGIAGETSASNYKTFDGEGNSIGGMLPLGDDLVIHRDDSQEICTGTQSAAQPFVFRTNDERLGVRDFSRSNRIVSANGRHFIWTRRGPYAFDGRNLMPLAEDIRPALRRLRFIGVRGAIRHVALDAQLGRIYWFAANTASRWGEYATPDLYFSLASATLTTPDGGTFQNYTGCFVYDYETNDYWFEDRPASVGSGMVSANSAQPAQLCVSRNDGSIIVLNGRNKGYDASLSKYNGSWVLTHDPADTSDDVKVVCTAELPWLDFGTQQYKRVTRIETSERALSGEGPWDNYTDTETGNRGLRIIIYGDANCEDELSDCLECYDSANTQLAATSTLHAAPFLREFSPRAHGKAFKLIVTNILTATGALAGMKHSPFRLSDITIEFEQMSSLQPREVANSGLSEYS